MSEDQRQTPNRISPKLLRWVQGMLIATTAFLFVSHVVKWNIIQVDSVTLALMGLLLAIPFLDLVRKIKVGEFEAEIGKAEVSKAQERVAIELSTPSEKDESEKQVRDLLRNDPRLAMAKIRIDLEEALKRLYSAALGQGQDLRRISLGRLVDDLVHKQVLGGPIASSVRDVIALANRAVHGERIELSTAEELAMLGVRLVQEVQQAYIDYLLKPIDKSVITAQEIRQYESAKYRVTTIVPLVENPFRNIYIFDQEALNSFLEGYEEYAESIIEIVRV